MTEEIIIEKAFCLCNNDIDHDNTKSLIRAIKPSCISSWLYKGLLI